MEFNAEDLETGRHLFAQNCTFMLGVASLKQLPDDSLPEIAFAGRSNVGKSSLINSITGRNSLARTSNTPGRTRELNFFDLGGRMRIVDMPGYGYARASKSDVKNWNLLIKDYLRGRQSLRKLLILIDSRHGMKESDRELMDMLDDAAVQYNVIMTKADKVTKAILTDTHGKISGELKKRAAASPDVLTSSSAKKQGIEEIRAMLASMANPA